MSTTAIRRLADLLVGITTAAFLIVVALSDLADGGHAVWRDPLSYFGAESAPHNVAFQVALASLGVGFGLWIGAHAARLRTAVVVLCLMASASIVGLALWPIDCSPVDDLCEIVIRGRAASWSHNAHSVFAVVLFVSLALVSGIMAKSSRALSRRSRWAIRIGAVFVALGAGSVLVFPFAPGAAVGEAIAVVGTAALIRTSVREAV